MAPQLWAMYVETCYRLCVEVTGINTDAPKTLGLGLSFTWRDKTTPMAAKVIMPVNFESWHHFTFVPCPSMCRQLYIDMPRLLYSFKAVFHFGPCIYIPALLFSMGQAICSGQFTPVNLLQQYCAPHKTYWPSRIVCLGPHEKFREESGNIVCCCFHQDKTRTY